MAGMTKEDRAEYETRLAACGYWERLSHENALNYGLTSKRDFLNRKRAEEAEAMAQAETVKEETETRPTLWGIWHMENGKATLCESDESMTVYYDCAFQNEANARAYAASVNDRWNNNAATHGWIGNASYFAAPLPEGCKPEWIDDEESETATEETAAVILPLDNLPKPEDFQIESEYLCALCDFGMSGVKLPEGNDDSDEAAFLRWDYAVKEEFILHRGAEMWAQYQERLATESVEPKENPFAVAIAQAAETFGNETVAAFLACPSRDRFAFVQSLFNSNPIAACILYAIDESVINANDEHGFHAFSAEWLDCFAATLHGWLDDWSMIEHSGIARINWEIWQEIGNRIHAYHRGELQTVETFAEIALHFWDIQMLLAEDAFRANPTESNKLELIEFAEIRFAAYRARVLEIYSNAKEGK